MAKVRGNPAKLVPNSAKTPQQRKEQAAKAGRASGVAKRKQKSIREAIKSLLSQKLGSGTLQDDPGVQSIMAQFGLTGEDCVTALAAASMLKATIAGSPQHAKLLVDIAGTEDEKNVLPAKIVVEFGDNSEKVDV